MIRFLASGVLKTLAFLLGVSLILAALGGAAVALHWFQIVLLLAGLALVWKGRGFWR